MGGVGRLIGPFHFTFTDFCIVASACISDTTTPMLSCSSGWVYVASHKRLISRSSMSRCHTSSSTDKWLNNQIPLAATLVKQAHSLLCTNPAHRP